MRPVSDPPIRLSAEPKAATGPLSPERFAFWLQGFAELHQEPPTPAQWATIKEHLEMVFEKAPRPSVTPDEFFDEVQRRHRPENGIERAERIQRTLKRPERNHYRDRLIC